LESGYFVVARRQKACPLPPPQHAGARSGVNGSLRSRRIGVHHSPPYFVSLGGWSAATATGAAASESVYIDEVDAYVLIGSQGADHRTKSGRGAARAADDLANIVRIHPHLEHPPATKILLLDRDIVRMRDDPSDQMLERLSEH
jgi:hypothetical protein